MISMNSHIVLKNREHVTFKALWKEEDKALVFSVCSMN